MTVASTATFELSVDQLLRRAFQLAGLYVAAQSPRADDMALARDLLGMELDALQAEGVVLRTVIRTTLPLVTSTSSYTLANDVIDVFTDPSNMAGMIVPASGGETPVRAISRMEYQQIVKKDVEATPTLVYVEKLETVSLHFWPVPPTSTTSFRYSEIRLPRDSTTGAVTMDLARRWQKAMLWTLAYAIAEAKSAPAAKVARLERRSDIEKTKARMNDVEKGHIQLYVERYY